MIEHPYSHSTDLMEYMIKEGEARDCRKRQLCVLCSGRGRTWGPVIVASSERSGSSCAPSVVRSCLSTAFRKKKRIRRNMKRVVSRRWPGLLRCRTRYRLSFFFLRPDPNSCFWTRLKFLLETECGLHSTGVQFNKWFYFVVVRRSDQTLVRECFRVPGALRCIRKNHTFWTRFVTMGLMVLVSKTLAVSVCSLTRLGSIDRKYYECDLSMKAFRDISVQQASTHHHSALVSCSSFHYCSSRTPCTPAVPPAAPFGLGPMLKSSNAVDVFYSGVPNWFTNSSVRVNQCVCKKSGVIHALASLSAA